MALSFNKAAGGAKKSSITSYAYRDGDNEVRFVGDVTRTLCILARRQERQADSFRVSVI